MSDLSFCARQVQRLDNDRFLCALFAPASEREALCAVYAFNIEVARARDAVREPMLGRIRLQWWWQAIADIYARKAPREPVAVALADAIARFDLSRGHFECLLRGREFDYQDQPPCSLEDLVAYASTTSTPLVKLSAEVCGVRCDRIADVADDMGIAWALTGLVRAVPFHARARRLYLPTALFDAHSVDQFALFEKGFVPGLDKVVAAVSDRAVFHLVRARDARGKVPRSALPAFLPATLASRYLKRIAAAGHNPFSTRVQDVGVVDRPMALLLNRLRQRY